jgi:hypothetical protein
MALSPEDIVERILDDLIMGEFGDSVDALEVSKSGPGSLVLDYGKLGRFRLSVVEESV